MKRVVSFLLSLILPFSAPAFAGAENEPSSPLRVLDAWWAAEAYQAAYPGRTVETIERAWDELGNSDEEAIIRSGDWDAACIDTMNYSLSELTRLGLTLELDSCGPAMAAAEGLYPSIRSGCSVGGKLVALPAGHLGALACGYRLAGTDYQGNEDAEGVMVRDRLGFSADDQPTTFAEVCELGLRYLALDPKTRKGSSFLYSSAGGQGRLLLDQMIRMYIAEASDESGGIDFDTPAFRAALENAAPLLEAFEADAKRARGAGAGGRPLLEESTGVPANCRLPRITEGASFPAHMSVVIVNPNSARLAEAIDFAVTANGCGESTLPLLLYENANYDALLQQCYDDLIAAQIAEGEDASVIEELEARKAAGDEKYFIPRSVVARYAEEVAPFLSFPRYRSFPTDEVVGEYLRGKTDEDGFIAALNEQARKN